jgi:aldose sugar dehydrogenase
MNFRRFMILLGAAIALGSSPPAAAGGFQVETVAAGLDHPWSLAFLPDGRMLVTERAGRLRIIEAGRLLPDPVEGVPAAYVRDQAGLLEVALDPAYAENGWIYLSLVHGTARANNTRVIRARLRDGRLHDLEVVFTARPLRNTAVHYGGRMVFLPDGTLVIGLGDGFDFREDAQRLDNHNGKIVRIHPDGSIPADNPFAGRDDALPEIWSFGHRNVQGLAYDGQNGILWAHEHGPRGGDELNLIVPGGNYGWPVATLGVDYSGARVTPYTSRPGMNDPLVGWTPAIAPSGMTLYQGDEFPEWRGDLLITALVAREVRRIHLEGGDVTGEEALFSDIGERLRDVRMGLDGAVYVLTDSAEGRVLRITATPDGD